MAPRLRDQTRYDILGEHGRGGLGRVSRAHDRELGRDIAIKELISRGQLSEMRFLREALITARLEHPGIVPVYEAGRWSDGTPFYAMKLVAGRPLRDLILERTTVDERIALLHHVIAVADAMAYAHGRNIIHRDLKPANVIVGDFGETVVIDWGLAKDLTVAEESIIGGGPFREARDDGLTSTGTVLGTPAYMAPEQARGEPVDQRADVYAIGGMLWELCSLQKLPPHFSGQRRPILRNSGIDPDLLTIVDKAVDPDPARRYPNAGALAVDLKAFKAGARIAARRYSLWALLEHWTRRHRRLAWSIAGIVALALATALFYVHGIATERDRADASNADAKRARATSEQSLNELTLKHAELLLQSDPTAAVTVLRTYHGSDTVRHMQLLAEARGRGVAREVLQPHNDNIHLLIGQADGSIVSLGEDHRVRSTSQGRWTTLASDVSDVVCFAYAPTRQLLAYATLRHEIALMDLRTNAIQRVATESPSAMALASDGSRLAVLDKSGTLTVWDRDSRLTPRYHAIVLAADSLDFIGNNQLVLAARSHLQVVRLDDNLASSLPISATAIDSNGQDIAVGSSQGNVLLVSSGLAVTAELHVCKEQVTVAKFIPHRNRFAFACHEGGVGIVSYSRASKELVKIGGFQTRPRPFILAIDDSGEHIVTSSGSDVYLHYIDSGLTTVLHGQAATITAITAPTKDFRYVLSGDINGTMRVWDLEEPHARILAHVQGKPFGARFAPDGSTLAVYGLESAIHVIHMNDGSVTELRGHTNAIRGVTYFPDSERLVSFSWDETARVWSTGSGTSLRVFDGHHALVQNGAVVSDGSVATIGDDGHLFEWGTHNANVVPMLRHNEPLITLLVLGKTNDLVVGDSSGNVWIVPSQGSARQIRSADEYAVTKINASYDGKFLAIGQESGSITVYRTSDWSIDRQLVLKGTIARIEFDPLDRDMLINSEDGFVRLVPLDTRRSPRWTSMQVRARDVRYSPTGDLIAITSREGGTWFYSMQDDSWRYFHDHPTTLVSGQFSPDGSKFVSIDQDGTVVTRDIVATVYRPINAIGH
jgi:serine/threonine protein kinase/WD40 repeat protein